MTPLPTLAAENIELVGHLGGAIGAIAIQGDYAYVGGDYGFNVLDVSEPARPVQLSYLAVPVRDLEVVDFYAYILDGQTGLRILDLFDPFAPNEIGSYKLPDDTWHLTVANGVEGKRRHAFVMSRESGLYILDVTDPSAPVPRADYRSSADRHYEIALSDAGSEELHVFLSVSQDTVHGFSQTVEILDVSSHSMPTRVATIEGLGGILVVIDSYLYVSQVYDSTTVFDVSDPHHPRKLGTFDFFFLDASREGDYLYAVRPEDNLGVLDVSDPAKPVQVASAPPFFNDYAFQPMAIATDGQHVYAANNKGLYVVDVADPAVPSQAGFYDTLTASADLTVKGGFAFLSRGDAYNSWSLLGAFSSVDVSNPTAPFQAGYHELKLPSYRLAMANGFAYVGQGHCSWGTSSCSGELSVFDVSDPSTLKEVGRHEMSYPYPSKAEPDWLVTDVSAVKVQVYLTGLPYEQVDHGGLEILQVPDSVTIVGTKIITSGLASEPWWPAAVEIVDEGQIQYAYLADYQYGLRIVDLADRSGAAEVGSFPIPKARDVAVLGQRAYLVDETNLWIIDVSDLSSLKLIQIHPVQGGAGRLTMDGQLAYITNNDRLQILDLTDPLQPRSVGFYITTGNPNSVAVEGGFIFVADRDGGLVILRQE